jgi:hypothetical protein
MLSSLWHATRLIGHHTVRWRHTLSTGIVAPPHWTSHNAMAPQSLNGDNVQQEVAFCPELS